MRRTLALILLFTSSALLSTGCGGDNGVRVTGKLVKGGSRYTPPAGHQITITFIAIDAKDMAGKTLKDEPFQAILEQDGETFSVPGREGNGIPPGKYRIAVTQRMTREAWQTSRPKAEPGKPAITRETDFLEDKFGEKSSPIVREIKGSTDLVVDLDKPEGA